MEVNNITAAVSKALAQTSLVSGGVESIHHAEIDSANVLTLLSDPTSVLKALRLPLSDTSQVQVTVKNRAQREPVPAARMRPGDVILIHWSDCCWDIIIFV